MRWTPKERLVGDYDGRERTLEVFNANARDQLQLRTRLRPIREAIESACGGSLVIIFHSEEQSASRYADFLREFGESAKPPSP